MSQERRARAARATWALYVGLVLLALVAAPPAGAQRRCKYADWKCPERDGRQCCTTATPRKADGGGRGTKLASVWLDSNPHGAVLTVDGERKGVTPWAGRLAPREHQVTFSLDGYETVDVAVRVKKRSGEQATIVVLPKHAAPAGVAAAAAPTAGDARAAAPVPVPSCPPDMVAVPGGTFWMGSADREGAAEERPRHRVTLGAYCIDRTEVTVEAYEACVAAGTCAERDFGDSGALCNASDVAALQRHPVNCVTWDQAAELCAWAKKRLPTEAEWEYAARGGEGRRYPWGDDAPGPTRLNACGAECRALGDQQPDTWTYMRWEVMYEGDDRWGATAPVGSFPRGASPVGALDMAGNVAEWVADVMGAYSAEDAVDPTGPAAGVSRVIRGGGWREFRPPLVTTAARAAVQHNLRGGISWVGFRCARGTR